MKVNDRSKALNVLIELLQKHTPLSHSLQNQTPLTKALCFGVSRHYVRLEALALMLVNKRPKDLDVWLCIVLGLYQLMYLDMPEYAVVQETVALSKHKLWAKNLVNAVLRRFCREKDALLQHPSYLNSTNHPDWLVAALQQDWPDHWQAILTANDQHPPMTLRVNLKQQSREDYVALLQEQGIEAIPLSHSPSGLMLTEAKDVKDLPGFFEGKVSVQDGAPQLAAALLDLKPGLRVLDACAAPGGKTGHILETEACSCLALDISASRLTRVEDNLTRLGLEARLIKGDASKPKVWWDGKPFDRILLDAPCSATGVIRRQPDIKLLRTPDEVQQISDLQASILEELWPLLSPGGLLVYATCSVLKVENESQIAKFVALHEDASAITGQKPWGQATGLGVQILPGEEGMDGFYYAVLRKAG